jgi:RNA polymerase sigma-70 factor (ECF subfamily)
MIPTETIWKEYHAKLRTFVERRIDDRAAAEDVLQEVFLKVHAGLASLKADTKLQSWLYQITRNAVIDYYRSRKPTELPPVWLQQPESEPSEQARRELEACLRPMIDQLPVRYREALTLSELKNLPQKEVAKKLDISLSGAKSRVQRGRSMVKDLLMNCCKLEFDHRGQLMDYEKREGSCDPC